MSLKMFFDAACTKSILTAEKFTGSGPFTLTSFTGAQLGGVYKETKITYTDISFSLGLGTGFTGLTIDALKGNRVIHNGIYVGQVVSNTTDSIIVTDSSYTATTNATTVSSYVKMYSPIDFIVTGNVITMQTSVAGNEVIHAIPTDTLSMYFGGAAGSVVTKTAQIYVKRTDNNFAYMLLQVTSSDTSVMPYFNSAEGISFTNGSASGFSGLPVNGLIGKAVNHQGVYVGRITNNTASTIFITPTFTSIDDLATNKLQSAGVDIYNVGTLEFSVDGTTYAPAVELVDLKDNVNICSVYVKDTLNIPTVAINYPTNIIKVSGLEYIA